MGKFPPDRPSVGLTLINPDLGFGRQTTDELRGNYKGAFLYVRFLSFSLIEFVSGKERMIYGYSV